MMVTRFAPSPTGPLHLGHAFSALTIQRLAGDGDVLLRIEDTDSARARRAFETQIFDDLEWLDFRWRAPVRCQSDHRAAHDAALERLSDLGVLYPCSCSRRDIADAGARAGRMGLVYPGTCRGRSMADERPGDALRLDVGRALDRTGDLPLFRERGPLYRGAYRPDARILRTEIGDPVLRRRQSGDISYDLACPHDDAVQSVTHVIRGADLWDNTPLHVLIQTLCGWPVADYYHHDLVRDTDGRRLAKIDRSKAIATYRAEGLSRDDVVALLPPLPLMPLAA